MKREIDWRNVAFLTGMHLLALVGLVVVIGRPLAGPSLALAIAWYLASGMGITAGYHRLFSHSAYRAHPVVRTLLLLFGAAAFQNSALKWSCDHRLHHVHTDTDLDPYSVKKGLLWAHVGWILYRDNGLDETRVRDLSEDPLVRWQHRHYVLLAVAVAFVVPALLGLLWGDPLGAFLLAGPIRLVAQWHATFAINSLAHWIGRQPYCTRTTARDSGVVALLTMGEGYHNFHHRFPTDYRNGLRWHHFDPTKWFVASLAGLRLARDLRRTPAERIAMVRSARIESGPGARRTAS